MQHWIDIVQRVLAIERDAVVVTVAATQGSAPREAGARMIVAANSIEGTIGGGHLEFDAIRIARDALAAPAARGNWLVRFPLAARLGQCCGGVASLLFQPVTRGEDWLRDVTARLDSDRAFALVTPIGNDSSQPHVIASDASCADARLPDAVHASARALARQREALPLLISHTSHTYLVERLAANDFRVVLFGNGHVGRALAQVLATLDCTVTWIDQREHAFASTLAANIIAIATDDPVDEVKNAPPGSMFLVMTHSHALDFELTSAILKRDDFLYFGLIGSRSKRAQFERRLAARDVATMAVERMTCPIGVGAIRSKHPGAIAVAVAAEMLALREVADAAGCAGANIAAATCIRYAN